MEIIAELAQGFEGRAEQARLLLKAAASAGADAAKFQLVYADELAAPGYTHYDLFTSLEMDDAVWTALAGEARSLGVALHFDIFGPRSLALAERVGAAAIKLHPTDVANKGLLELAAASAIDRIVLGAGGCHRGELSAALEILARKRVVVLLGFQGYPTPDAANQIHRVAGLRRAYPHVAAGFADHAAPDTPLRYALAAAAVGAGATVIEKHLTLGRVMALEDHESALNPDEFAEFVRVIRACAAAYGEATGPNADDDFGMPAEEARYRSAIRRHVVAARPLPRGHRIAPSDVVLKRTSASAPLTDPAGSYGRTLARDVAADAALTAADLTEGS